MTAVTERKRPVLVFLGLIAASRGALLLLPPILQDQSYHRFADKRTLLGVQNFWNGVASGRRLGARAQRSPRSAVARRRRPHSEISSRRNTDFSE
jgi:hypothetical protein